MNLQELVRRVRFEEVWPILKRISRWADDGPLYFRIGYDLARVIEGEPSDKPIVIAREEDRDGTWVSASSCEGNWLEHNLLREIRLEGGLQLSEAEIVAHILNDTSYLCPCRGPYRNLLPNRFTDKLDELDARDQRMRDSRRERLREKYERLREVQDRINEIVSAHCGVSEQDLHYLFDAKEIMTDDLCSARCAENERVEYLFDLLRRDGRAAYGRCDSMVLVFTTDLCSPLTDSERRSAEEFLDKLAPLQRVMILNEQIQGFGPYIDMQITGSYAR